MNYKISNNDDKLNKISNNLKKIYKYVNNDKNKNIIKKFDQRLEYLSNEIDNLFELSEDILLDLDLKYSKKCSKLEKKIKMRQEYQDNFKKMMPLLLYTQIATYKNDDNPNSFFENSNYYLGETMLSEDDYSDNNLRIIKCDKCNKTFNGNNIVKRYRQHLNSKH